MSRFKFRAWNKARGGWVNSLVLGKMHVNSITNPHDNSIIEQFTGLKDKNGTEVYEGDIARCPWENGHKIATVTWCEEEGMFVWNNGYCVDRVSDGEVIGNIHDNEDLLK
jgi:uncharacterized phage protein (TIGR01671 family)